MELKLINHQRNQHQIFIGRTDAEFEALILWPTDGKNCPIGKDHEGRERLKAEGEGGDRG